MAVEARTIDARALAERGRVLRMLRKHEADLRALGVTRLRLFGSMARGDADSDSDVDLIADIDPHISFSLLDLVGLQGSPGSEGRCRDDRSQDAPAVAGAVRGRGGRGLLMASAEVASRLEDILEAIAAIEAYTSGKSFDDYVAERMLRDAVERNVERLSEASRHIPRILQTTHPEIPWRKIAGIDNILRHA